MTQGDKRRHIIAELQKDYGIELSRDAFEWNVNLFSNGVPQMESFTKIEAIDFIFDDNIEIFAYFIYGLNAFKNFKKKQ